MVIGNFQLKVFFSFIILFHMHTCAGPRPPLPPCVLGCARLKPPLPPMLHTYYVHSPLLIFINFVLISSGKTKLSMASSDNYNYVVDKIRFNKIFRLRHLPLVPRVIALFTKSILAREWDPTLRLFRGSMQLLMLCSHNLS